MKNDSMLSKVPLDLVSLAIGCKCSIISQPNLLLVRIGFGELYEEKGYFFFLRLYMSW